VAAALLALAACEGVQANVDRALQRMREQPKADAYEASGVFPDGKVLQVAPAGTVAREDVLDPALATGRDSAGAYLARVPMPVAPALLERGRSRFRIVCGACHGPGGFGGSVVAENWTPPRPPSLRAGPAAVLAPGMLYEVVRNGFGRMPPYASDLPVTDRWAIVAYALTIRGRSPADSAERDDSARAAELRRLDARAPGAAP
jgi:mono/diheme cytochrome c family protein